MTIRQAMLCAAITLGLGSACSKKDPAEKMVTMMEELGNAVDSANGDCGKMADGVQAVADKYKGDIDSFKELKDKSKTDKDQQKALMDKYGDRIQKATPKLMGLMNCANDPKMKAVGDRLKGMM